MLDKQAIENIPSGSLQVSISGSDSWSNSDNANLLAEKVRCIIVDLAENKGIPLLPVLRSILVSSDFFNEVKRWQKSLGHPETVTNNENATAVGKAFVWGDEQEAFGAVILDERIAFAFLQGHGLAIGLIIHELTHVFWDSEILRKYGSEPWPGSNNLPAILRHITRSVISEFLAECVAGDSFAEEDVKGSMELAGSALTSALDAVNKARVEYDHNDDITALWLCIMEHTCTVLLQMGRVIGLCISTASDQTQSSLLSDTISNVSPEWTPIAKNLANILPRFRTLDVGLVNEYEPVLSKLVIRCFRLLRIEPLFRPETRTIDWLVY